MREPGYVLGIDLGTSGPKAALVSATGELLGNHSAPVELQLRPGGGAEQDPEHWWQALTTASRRVVTAAAVPVERIRGVSVTAQWSGTVPVDAAGNPLGNAVIWMDARGAPYVRRLVGGPVTISGYDPRKLRMWIRLTGGAPSLSGKDPLAHILFLQHERPEVHAAATTFFEPKDYLNFRLTGVRAATYDSIALHWVTDNRDPAAVEYDETLLAAAGLDGARLPSLRPATTVLGGLSRDAANELGLPAGIPVVGGTPDLHSAAIGAGTTSDGAAHLYLGTSSWLVCHVPFKKTDLIHNLASLPAPIPDRYLAANEQETAGKALEWLSRLLYPAEADRDEVYRELNEVAARVPPGSGGVVFTPWLYGERSPVEDAALRAGFHNQSLDTGRAEMIRAVFEGVAYNTRWLLRYVERFVGSRLDPIVAVGGGARSNLWCQIHADVLDRTIYQADEPLMVNVRGAGLLGHVALGHITWAGVPRLVPVTASYTPNPATAAVYARSYDAFRRIHRANRGIYRRLHRDADRS